MDSLDAAVRAVLDFVGANPALGILIVFLAALSESIPVIGAVLPGTAVVVGAGALVGLGRLPLAPVLVAAALGAILSDGLAFAWGRRAGQRAFALWPLSRHPAAVDAARAYFGRHGGKSVAVARFTPVVRAFVPLIAGASGMPAGRFYAANVLSALAWAPIHVLPGAVLGASLGALGRVSGRGLTLLAIVAATAFVLAWLLRLAWRLSRAGTARAQGRLLRWGEGRPGPVAGLLRAVLDSERSAARQASLLAALFGAAVLGLANLTDAVLDQGGVGQADAAVANLADSLRTAWGDRLLTAITTLADTPVTAGVALVAAAWLWWAGQRRLATGYASLVALTAALTLALKATTRIPRPHPLYAGAVEFSFPSGHVTFVAGLYGVLAWILARDLPRPWRGFAAGVVGTLIAAVAVSRVYLGAHWPSDVTAGLLYGLGATAAFALAFRSVALTGRQRLGTALVAVAALTVVGGWHLSRSWTEAVARYAFAPPEP